MTANQAVRVIPRTTTLRPSTKALHLSTLIALTHPPVTRSPSAALGLGTGIADSRPDGQLVLYPPLYPKNSMNTLNDIQPGVQEMPMVVKAELDCAIAQWPS
jgi:hypothetical protein